MRSGIVLDTRAVFPNVWAIVQYLHYGQILAIFCLICGPGVWLDFRSFSDFFVFVFDFGLRSSVIDLKILVSYSNAPMGFQDFYHGPILAGLVQFMGRHFGARDGSSALFFFVFLFC